MRRDLCTQFLRTLLITLVIALPNIEAIAQTVREAPYRARLLNLDNPERIPGRFVVRFRSSLELGSLRPTDVASLKTRPELLPTSEPAARVLAGELASSHGAVLIENLASDIHSRRGFYVEGLTDAEAESLASDPRIDSIEAVPRVVLDLTQSSGWKLPSPNPSQEPDKEIAPPYLDKLDQNAYPLNETYTFYARGSGVDIWILDTGLFSGHSEFGGRAATAVVDCSVPNCSGTVSGNDIAAHTLSEGDCNGHGTLVAGVAAGEISGVAKNANVFGVRTLENCQGGGTAQDLASGVRWVTNHKSFRPTVINISSHVPGGFGDLDNAVSEALAAGITVVASSGNSGEDACTLSPQRVAGVITVGASSTASGLYDAYESPTTDEMVADSGHGPCVSVFTEGYWLQSALPDNSWLESTCLSTRFSGNNLLCELSLANTSLAAPQAAGVAAQYLQTHPSATPAQVKSEIVASAFSNMTGSLGGSPNKRLTSLVSGNNPDLDPNDGGGGNPPQQGTVERVMRVIVQFIMT